MCILLNRRDHNTADRNPSSRGYISKLCKTNQYDAVPLHRIDIDHRQQCNDEHSSVHFMLCFIKVGTIVARFSTTKKAASKRTKQSVIRELEDPPAHTVRLLEVLPDEELQRIVPLHLHDDAGDGVGCGAVLAADDALSTSEVLEGRLL